jgi:hypothetical protein
MRQTVRRRRGAGEEGSPSEEEEEPEVDLLELVIRIPEECQSALGRKKVTRTVYAVNKREDLKGQVRDFMGNEPRAAAGAYIDMQSSAAIVPI